MTFECVVPPIRVLHISVTDRVYFAFFLSGFRYSYIRQEKSAFYNTLYDLLFIYLSFLHVILVYSNFHVLWRVQWLVMRGYAKNCSVHGTSCDWDWITFSPIRAIELLRVLDGRRKTSTLGLLFRFDQEPTFLLHGNTRNTHSGFRYYTLFRQETPQTAVSN